MKPLLLFVALVLASGLLKAAEKEATQAGAQPSPADTVSTVQGADSARQHPSADKRGKDAIHAGVQDPMSATRFATQAAESGLYEIDLGRLAEKKGVNPVVKTFGQELVRDHTKASAKLDALARSKEIKLPASPSDAQVKNLRKLSELEGTAFDEAFTKEAVASHEEAVILFKDASATVTDRELKGFATAALPVLEKHLAEAKALRKLTD